LIPAPKARSITLDWEAFTVVARDKKIPCAGTFVELGRAHPHPRGALPSEHLPWLKLGERNGFTVLETPDGHYWKDCEIHAGTLVRALENTGPRGPEELGEALVGSVGITNGTQTSPVTNNAPSAQTAKAETDCRKRLVKMMRESPNKKLTSKAEIGLLFPNIGGRAFERAWRQAIDETGATAWSKAGAPRGRRKVRPQVQLKKIAAAEITAAK
jgi:hypothetical protein